MKNDLVPRKFRLSIFWKVSLSFVFASLLVIGIVQVLMTQVVSPNSSQLRIQDTNRSEYTLYLLDHLGLPPDPARAKKMAKDLDLEIRVVSIPSGEVKGQKVLSTSSIDFPSFEQIKKTARQCPTRPVSVAKWGQRIITLVERNGYQYTVSFKSDAFSDGRIDLVPLLIGLILLVFVGCYLWIRWLFKPLKEIMEGVQKLAAGDLQTRVFGDALSAQVDRPKETFDEWTTLGMAFNEMVEKIRAMVHARDQLLWDVSHELRSPLTRLKLALELDGPELKPRVRKNVEVLEKMVQELLESARLDLKKDSIEKEEVQWDSFLKEILADLEGEKPGILLTEGLPSIFVGIDPILMGSALRNLLDNALKYSHHQEKPVEVFYRVLPSSGFEDSFLELVIKDFGCGIPAAESALVFEPFYRVDKSRRQVGYGLGLGLAKKILEAHHGELRIDSQEGLGTIVRIKIPTRLGGLQNQNRRENDQNTEPTQAV